MAADHVIYVHNRCDPVKLRSSRFSFQMRQQEPETGLFFFNLLHCLHLLQSSIEGKAVDIFNIIVLHPEMAHKWGGSITNSYVSWMSLLILCLFTRLKILQFFLNQLIKSLANYAVKSLINARRLMLNTSAFQFLYGGNFGLCCWTPVHNATSVFYFAAKIASKVLCKFIFSFASKPQVFNFFESCSDNYLRERTTQKTWRSVI